MKRENPPFVMKLQNITRSKKSLENSRDFYYMRLEYGPPYWLMINFASAGFGFLILIGYSNLFS